jgi:beta-glucosidase
MTHSLHFPPGFIWGAATAAHQIEGGNSNNDWWALEHAVSGPCIDVSGDAADSYNRFGEDIGLLADLGLTSYRFSLEWSRIVPAEGEYSRAQRDHYRRMVQACLDRGVLPHVTLQHFSLPLWLSQEGGWKAAQAVDSFRRYIEWIEPVLEDVQWVCTINEPNIAACFSNLKPGAGMQTAGLPPMDPEVADRLIEAHHAARPILHAMAGGKKVGWGVATQAFTPVNGAEQNAKEWAAPRETRFIVEAAQDDWIGIQAYTRTLIGHDGPLPAPEGSEFTATGWEYFPAAAEIGLRTAADLLPGKPLMVTENGIATDNDARRIDYTREALSGVHQAISDGLPVLAYYHWSLLDNFEWAMGYRPKFGLINVNPTTFARTPKPSAEWLGQVAKANAVTLPGR